MNNWENTVYTVNYLKSASRSILVRNIGIYTLGNILPQIINVLLLPVFTRYLTKAEYGILGYTTALNVFLFLLGSLSIHAYVLRHYFECTNEEEKKRLFGTIFFFLLVYNFFLLGAEILLLPILFNHFRVQVPFEPYIKLSLLINFIEVFAVIPQVYFRVRQKAASFVVMTSSFVILSTAASLYLVVWQKMGVLGRYYGLLGANLIFLCFYLIFSLRISKFVINKQLLKKALKFSLPLIPGALFLSITTVSDRLILERFTFLSRMGIYVVGFTLGSALNFITLGIFRALEPEIYRLAGELNFNIKMLAFKRYVVVFLLGIGCIMITFSREIVTLLASSDFYESYKILALIVIAFIFQGISIPVSCHLFATYNTRYIPLISLIGVLSSVGINLILIPKIGIYGAAFSAIISSCVILVMYKIFTERLSDIKWRLGSDFLLIGAISILSFLMLQIKTPSFILTILVKLFFVLILSMFLIWYTIVRNKVKENATLTTS